MISDRFMEPGSWDVELRGMPQRIWERLRPFGPDQSTWFSLVVTPAWNPEAILDPASITTGALYAGVCTEVDQIGGKLSGQGLLWWLGKTKVGQVVDMSASTVSSDDLTLNQWISRIVSGTVTWGWNPSGLVLGSVTSFGSTLVRYGNLNEQHKWLSRIELLEWLRDGPTQGLLEWRVTPSGALNVGYYGDLWNDVVSIVVQRDDRSGAGSDNWLAGLRQSQLGHVRTTRETITGLLMIGAEDALAFATVPSMWPSPITHNFAEMATVIERPEVTSEWLDEAAQTEIDRTGVVTETITIDSEIYEVRGDGGLPGRPSPGSLAAVYDPESGLVSAANAIPWRGTEIYPTWTRVYATKWPIEQGMGVYASWWNGLGWQLEDLTRYVIPETGGWTFEVGSPLRGLSIR